jgi:hypothetical protein
MMKERRQIREQRVTKARDKAKSKKFWLDVFFITILSATIFVLIGGILSLLAGA